MGTTCSRPASREGPAIGRGLRAALAAKLDGRAVRTRAELAEALSAAGVTPGEHSRREPSCTPPSPFYPRASTWRSSLPGAQALFTTRRGGFSEGPYASLNLGG